MATESDPSARLRTVNTVLALVILVLLGQAAWQASRVSALTAQLEQAQRDLETRVERMAVERLTLRREDLTAMVQWLDEVYRGADGLQRPTGLTRADGAPDAEAIGAWIFDIYLKARIEGKSDEEARQIVLDNIRSTDEWRQKHPKG
jgi:hypothetical protein